MSNQGLSGQGLLMIVVGVWLILRTVVKDGSQRTLVDHILQRPAGDQTSGGSGGFLSGLAGDALSLGNVAVGQLP